MTDHVTFLCNYCGYMEFGSHDEEPGHIKCPECGALTYVPAAGIHGDDWPETEESWV